MRQALSHDEDWAADPSDQVFKVLVLNQQARSGQNKHVSPLQLCDVDEQLDVEACDSSITENGLQSPT